VTVNEPVLLGVTVIETLSVEFPFEFDTSNSITQVPTLEPVRVGFTIVALDRVPQEADCLLQL
jgi:hypothetical protein